MAGLRCVALDPRLRGDDEARGGDDEGGARTTKVRWG